MKGIVGKGGRQAETEGFVTAGENDLLISASDFLGVSYLFIYIDPLYPVAKPGREGKECCSIDHEIALYVPS